MKIQTIQQLIEAHGIGSELEISYPSHAKIRLTKTGASRRMTGKGSAWWTPRFYKLTDEVVVKNKKSC